MKIVLEYSIQKADFEKQKKELKTFAEQPAINTELDKFSTDGQWSDFWAGGLAGVLSGHKVTGEEINSLVTKLQSCFVEINERNRKVIKEFGQVYETFEALDKGYIQGILIGVKSAEKASQEAKDAQKDIDDTIKALQITIDKLKEFKGEINQYAHLKDIDSIWENTKNLQEEVSRLSDNLEKRIEKVETEISKIVELAKGQSHFGDIDNIWEGLQEVQKTVGIHSESIIRYEEVQERIDKELSDVSDFISGIQQIEHFNDIDAEWEFSHELIRNIEAIDNKVLTVEKNIQEYGERLQKAEDENVQLKSKINTAYIVAGGAIVLSVVHLILQLAGIL